MAIKEQTSHFHFTKRGPSKSFCIVNVSEGLSLDHAQEFGSVLMQFSGAQLTRVSHAEGIDIEGDSTSEGAYTTIGMYGMVFLRDQDLYTLKKIRIPAPLNECFDDEKINPLIGNTIATGYSNFTGRTFTFDHGGVAGRTANV